MSEVFSKIRTTIADTGKAVGEKTKQVSESAKLNAKIVTAEHTVTENYTLLGKFYYENCKDHPDEAAEEYVNSITAALDSIKEMKAQILSLKGAVKCGVCGCECPIEYNYCGKCGSVLEKPEFPEESEAFEGEVIANDTAEKPEPETDAENEAVEVDFSSEE